MRAVTAAEMRRIEEDAIASGTTVEELMQRAGRAVADHVGDILGGQIAQRRILVLAGPGKNGGDGLIAARMLRQRGASVTVVCPVARPYDDPLLTECAAAGCSITQDIPADLDSTLSQAEVIIDALLGTGRARSIDGPMLETLTMARGAAVERTVVAVDLPSGLDSDTGELDPATVAADFTVALGSVKLGCLTNTGAENSGAIRVADIGLGVYTTDDSGIDLLTIDAVQELLPRRNAVSHKGTFGHSLIVGGSEAYRGAPALAARAAARAGSGTVAIAAPDSITASLASSAPEATHIPLTSHPQTGLTGAGAVSQLMAALQAKAPDAFCIGPGLGRSVGTDSFADVLIRELPADTSALLDADALNRLAEKPDWWTTLQGPIVLTPHPGEMARLCRMSVAEVQQDRFEIAEAKAREWGVTVVLKGAYTVVASPDEPPAICPLAMPALASGGTGDALAGIITGFLSQGLSTYDAARAGVYVHGTAAALAAQGNGNMTSGLLASDLIEKIPAAMALIGRGEGPVSPLFA